MMAITTREDAVIGIMQKLMVGAERAFTHAGHIADEDIDATLEMLIGAIVLVSKKVCERMESTGTTPITPDNESGAGQ